MAATSLWHIKGRLKDLIDYVENPAKTVASDDLKDFFDVFSYVRNPEKTDNGEYVSAVNCLKETALEQMILTKKQYQKSGGYIAWHGYQSFRPNEVTPEQCHEIGLKLAREMWGDNYQIIVTTHLDKEHLHNHFCFNSVSFTDGHLGHFSQNLARECGDFILRRSDGIYAYQLAVAVDDARMGVTQVVRGQDLLSSTPRQIFLQRLLGLPTPDMGGRHGRAGMLRTVPD